MKRILIIMLGLSVFLWAPLDLRFSKENGIVTDSQTHLQWQDDYSDNLSTIKTATWEGAITYCEALALDVDGGVWRLPNQKELLSIVDYSVYDPSINSVFETTISEHYWSSTTYVAFPSSAWIVNFAGGRTLYWPKVRTKVNNTVYVRCVRGQD